MNPARFCLLLRAIFVCALMIFANSARAADAPQITVSAAASLKASLEEINKAQPSGAVILNIGGSGILQQQIENGAPVDVFISASPRHMDALEQKGLIIRETRKDLLRNELVLIAPKGKASPSSFEDLARPEVKVIAIGEPKSVPVGEYACEVFTKLKLLDALKPKLVFTLNVSQVLTTVGQGNADAGIVYVSDAQGSHDVQVVTAAPAESHSPIVYPIAVVKSSKHPQEAQRFASSLFTPEAAEVFRRHGFFVAP